MMLLRRLGVLATFLLAAASAQDACYCQPLRYTFTLDFSGVCENERRTTGGFTDTTCLIDEGTAVSATHIVVEELSQEVDARPINVVNITGPFSQGDTFDFESLLVSQPTNDSSTFPGGLIVEVFGVSATGASVRNIWIALFSNDCSIFPVLPVGDGFGWTTLVRNSLRSTSHTHAQDL